MSPIFSFPSTARSRGTVTDTARQIGESGDNVSPGPRIVTPAALPVPIRLLVINSPDAISTAAIFPTTASVLDGASASTALVGTVWVVTIADSICVCAVMLTAATTTV